MHVSPALCRFLVIPVPTWSATRLRHRALLASPLLSRCSLRLPELTRAYPGGGSHQVHTKRLRRFLNTRALNLWALRQQLALLALHTTRRPVGGRLPVLVDTTSWQPNPVVAAPVPWAGRAVLIQWRT